MTLLELYPWSTVLALSTIAWMTGQWLLLPLVALILVAEALSFMIQVTIS